MQKIGLYRFGFHRQTLPGTILTVQTAFVCNWIHLSGIDSKLGSPLSHRFQIWFHMDFLLVLSCSKKSAIIYEIVVGFNGNVSGWLRRSVFKRNCSQVTYAAKGALVLQRRNIKCRQISHDGYKINLPEETRSCFNWGHVASCIFQRSWKVLPKLLNEN